MKAAIFALAAFATAAVAQGSTKCDADYIVAKCMSDEQAKLANCAGQDYDCQCLSYSNLVLCFNNCPNDEQVHTYEGQKKIFCGYASQFPSATTKAATATTTTTPAKTTAAKEDDSTTTEKEAAGTGSPTSSSGSAAKTDSGAADLAYNAGGMLAAVAAVAAAVL
ncbi:hypothetical protein B0H66DRAFT_301736 [Apodospora peruviana]|uniref:GPI anchored serine-threonine rich protein n=1 Tax=Apodospora peruviana TaxID=516989 RepID=A0AAE0M3L6_9PEZI|nr:hypothetical protein B0H66DRAFT_301736 [Apodospora peruviana]